MVDRECAAGLVARAGQRRRAPARLRGPRRHRRRRTRRCRTSTARRSWCRSGTPVETLRTVKDDGEIALLREACAIGDRALARAAAAASAPGQTEREVARQLEAAMLEHGADGIAFETIVATGPNSAIPHHRPTDREIVARRPAQDRLRRDVRRLPRRLHPDLRRGARAGGLAARDLRRRARAPSGPAGTPWRPAPSVADVDAAARDVIAEAGYGEQFTHGLGPRRRPGDPRGAAARRTGANGTTRCPHAGHRRARGLPPRPRRRPHRGHPRRRRGRSPSC